MPVQMDVRAAHARERACRRRRWRGFSRPPETSMTTCRVRRAVRPATCRTLIAAKHTVLLRVGMDFTGRRVGSFLTLSATRALIVKGADWWKSAARART